ncbi:MAG: FAD-dependent oxidoreductase [Anaerolineae bacterium]|nr:FAD-dependent oxidoreductase [Anaerolineae bacterium]
MNKGTRADVVVVGGGPAGIGAAIAASRAGAETLLLERYGFFGGVAAYGCGMPINQMRPAGVPRGAVHELIIDRLLAYGEEAVRISDHALVCNVEYLKVAVIDALDQVNCRYWLHSRIVDTSVVQDRVTGVVLATKNGLSEIAAGIVIDATGDADVAAYAGAETMKGREPDGFLSPMTLNVIITNVDVPAARAFQAQGGLKRLLAEARQHYPLLPESMGLERPPFPIQNALVLNHSGTKLRGVLDGTRVEDLTEAEHYSRHQAIQIVQALRQFGGPAFAKVQLTATGPQVGVRETRRVKGLYVLTEDDALSGRRFDDAIGWRSGMLDIGFTRYEPMKVHDVPYRALVPERLDGLLAAGRCISATHVAASAGKSMGNCVATGHAAGLAAALSVARRCRPRDLDVRTLQAALRTDGVDLAWNPPPTYNAR